MNIISPSTPGGYSIFCDDIRQENNGKQILIGLYTGDMLIDAFPIQLPTFQVLIRYQERPDESILPVKFVIIAPHPTDEKIFETEVPREAFEKVLVPSDSFDDPFVSLNLHASFAGFVLARPGLIKVRAYRGDDEIRLGTLRVRLRSEWDALQKEIEGKEAAN
jgi:hypothetical protein